MQSIFDKETDRRGTGSMKWDVTPEELPMWVADMDFETAPAVQEAIRGKSRSRCIWLHPHRRRLVRGLSELVENPPQFRDSARLADFLHRRGSRHLQYRPENDHSGRKSRGSHPGLQYFL